MKRTRRSETPDKKFVPNRNGDGAVASSASQTATTTTVSPQHHSNGRKQPDSNPKHPTAELSMADQRENGEFEEVIVLAQESRLCPPEGQEATQQQHGDGFPTAMFRENISFKPLTTVEDISAHQGPDVA